MPPWKDIYKTDNERYETYQQSLVIYDFLVKAYEKLDYDIIIVPESKIENRVEFILNAMES
jgi:predicted ATPase